MTDKIHLTVAALVCQNSACQNTAGQDNPGQNNRYLMVREQASNITVINQPAGHVEPGESPIVAVKRETFEETGWRVEPTALLSFGVFTSPANGLTYYRFTFVCQALSKPDNPDIDPDILEVLWLTKEELLNGDPARSPMVLKAIEDYQSGIRYPLEFIQDYR